MELLYLYIILNNTIIDLNNMNLRHFAANSWKKIQ